MLYEVITVDCVFSTGADRCRIQERGADGNVFGDRIIDTGAQFIVMPVAVIADGIIAFLVVADQGAEAEGKTVGEVKTVADFGGEEHTVVFSYNFV